jgi:hypothetical protein
MEWGDAMGLTGVTALMAAIDAATKLDWIVGGICAWVAIAVFVDLLISACSSSSVKESEEYLEYVARRDGRVEDKDGLEVKEFRNVGFESERKGIDRG